MDRLGGEDAPRLHLVSFNAPQDVHATLSHLATECSGHFHSYCSTSQSERGGEADSKVCSVLDSSSCPIMEDSDIKRIKEEIVKAERVLGELKYLKHGEMGEQLLEILREVSECCFISACRVSESVVALDDPGRSPIKTDN